MRKLRVEGEGDWPKIMQQVSVIIYNGISGSLLMVYFTEGDSRAEKVEESRQWSGIKEIRLCLIDSCLFITTAKQT